MKKKPTPVFESEGLMLSFPITLEYRVKKVGSDNTLAYCAGLNECFLIQKALEYYFKHNKKASLPR